MKLIFSFLTVMSMCFIVYSDDSNCGLVGTIKVSIDNPGSNYHALEFTHKGTGSVFRWAQDGEYASQQMKYYLSILYYAKANDKCVTVTYTGTTNPYPFSAIKLAE